MTHIEQMIQDMCPNGVEWKTLGEVCKTSMGEFVKKDKQNPNAPYPVYNGGSTNTVFYDDYNTEANKVIISARGAAGFVNKVEVPFWAGNSCHVIDVIDNKLNWRFLYYYLKNHEYELIANQQKGGGVPAVSKKQIEAIEIPLPPIEIQKKIVECLDKFSALAAELQAELQVRRKQYEYYRTRLLTPHSDCNSADNTDDRNWECQRYTKGIAKVYDWQWKTLGEVCDLVKDRISASNLDTETYVSVENLLPNKMGKIASTSVPTTGNVINYHKDNVLIGNIRPYLRKIWLANCDGGTNGDVITLSIKDEYKNLILPRFLYHALADERFFIYDTQYSSGAKMPRGDKERVMEYQIALPPLAEQARIVAILDKFEALTTSLSDGIPAEQAAQQKRYEYYRDLLLTFDRKAV